MTLQVTYTYDALDRRIGVKLDADGAGPGVAVQTWTVYDGVNPYADFNGSGSLTMRYLHGLAIDELLARTDASNTSAWYLTDRLGTVRDIANTSGTVIYHAAYDSYGRKTAESGSGGDRFGYTGREHDAGTDLRYHRHRYVDAVIGAWINQDPIGFEAGDTNLYRYVGNSPTNATDPSGLCDCSITVYYYPITMPGQQQTTQTVYPSPQTTQVVYPSPQTPLPTPSHTVLRPPFEFDPSAVHPGYPVRFEPNPIGPIPALESPHEYYAWISIPYGYRPIRPYVPGQLPARPPGWPFWRPWPPVRRYPILNYPPRFGGGYIINPRFGR